MTFQKDGICFQKQHERGMTFYGKTGSQAETANTG
jgi:hypothetical protein